MDYGWTVGFGAALYTSPSTPWTKPKWSAQAIDLNQSYSAAMLELIKARSQMSRNDGMGAIMTYDLRIHTERDPLSVLQKIGEGAFSGSVSRASTPENGYTKDWTATTGTAINYDDIN